jgi:hypothetical protein
VTASDALTNARAARSAARRERRRAHLRRETLCLAIFGTVWLGFAIWYFAKGHPVGWGYVGTFVVYEVLNYVR